MSNKCGVKDGPKRRPILALLLLSGLCVVQSAYVLLTSPSGATIEWDPSQSPIVFQLWEGLSDPGTMTTRTSRWVRLLQALEEWTHSSTVSVNVRPTSTTDTRLDQINLVTMADTPKNRDLVGRAWGATSIWMKKLGVLERIIEADIVINPDLQHEDLFQVAMHEFGHSFGLKHTISRSSRMYFQAGSAAGASRLSWDDIGGVGLHYPLKGLDQITGSIAGRVTREGVPVFGAFVIATDSWGVLSGSAITLKDGSYKISLLPPGQYTVYAEPLDSPTTPYHLADSYFDPSLMRSDFQPSFFMDSSSPLVAVASRGTTAGVDLEVVSGNAVLDPEFIGVAQNPTGSLSVTSGPGSTSPGESDYLVVAGNGVEELHSATQAEVPGTSLSLGTLTSTRQNSKGLLFKLFPMAVSADAPEGEYSLVFNNTNQRGVISGGMVVRSAYSHSNPFAHFFHIPGLATSSLFLYSLDPLVTATGTLEMYPAEQEQSGYGLETEWEGNITLPSFTLGPGEATVLHTTGNSEFQGSLVARSDATIGAVSYVETPYGSTALNRSSPLYSFLVPVDVVSNGRTVDTGIAIANLDSRPSHIFLQIQDQSGSVRAHRTIELPGHGYVAQFVTSMASLPENFRGTILATSYRKVCAAAIRTAPGVFTTLPVIENSVGSRKYFPHFARAGSFTSELLLVNPSPHHAARGIRVQVRNTSGQPATVALNGATYESGLAKLDLPPLGSAALKTTQRDVAGWVEVQSDRPIGGTVLFSSPEAGTAGVTDSEPANRLVIPIQRELAQGVDTGIAVANTEDRQVVLTLLVRDSSGSQVLIVRTLTLAAREQFAEFPDGHRLALSLPDRFEGTVWVEADGYVSLAAIRQSPGGLTTFTPTILH